MFGGHQVFLTIPDPKNLWWLPNIFYDFLSKKPLVAGKHFF
jgi:hypothetical protein